MRRKRLLEADRKSIGRHPWYRCAVFAGLLAACGRNPVASLPGGGTSCWSCASSGRMFIGGTQSLFLGETGAGQFNRSVEATSGQRIRAGLSGADPLDTDFLEREAVELSQLRGAPAPRRLAAAIGPFTGVKREFLQAGIRRYGYVLAESRAHPIPDPCSYSGPLIPAGVENYDPRELCWWQKTFDLLGLHEGL